MIMLIYVSFKREKETLSFKMQFFVQIWSIFTPSAFKMKQSLNTANFISWRRKLYCVTALLTVMSCPRRKLLLKSNKAKYFGMTPIFIRKSFVSQHSTNERVMKPIYIQLWKTFLLFLKKILELRDDWLNLYVPFSLQYYFIHSNKNY